MTYTTSNGYLEITEHNDTIGISIISDNTLEINLPKSHITALLNRRYYSNPNESIEIIVKDSFIVITLAKNYKYKSTTIVTFDTWFKIENEIRSLK